MENEVKRPLGHNPGSITDSNLIKGNSEKVSLTRFKMYIEVIIGDLMLFICKSS